MKKIAMLLALSLSVVAINANATVAWIKTSDIQNFNHAVAGASKNTAGLPVIFPAALPQAKGVTYYANYDLAPDGYDLYIDSTADCAGAHACNLFMLNASNTPIKSLPVYKNMEGQTMTSSITLSNGTQANYTQGFAMADYWNPQIAWQQSQNTYTFSWKGVQSPDRTRKGSLKMVNNLQTFSPSAIAGS